MRMLSSLRRAVKLICISNYLWHARLSAIPAIASQYWEDDSFNSEYAHAKRVGGESARKSYNALKPSAFTKQLDMLLGTG